MMDGSLESHNAEVVVTLININDSGGENEKTTSRNCFQDIKKGTLK